MEAGRRLLLPDGVYAKWKFGLGDGAVRCTSGGDEQGLPLPARAGSTGTGGEVDHSQGPEAVEYIA
jgi:hypothetical protein